MLMQIDRYSSMNMWSQNNSGRILFHTKPPNTVSNTFVLIYVTCKNIVLRVFTTVRPILRIYNIYHVNLGIVKRILPIFR